MLTETISLSSPDFKYTGTSGSSTTLDSAIDHARAQLLALQYQEGYWVFELEADCTIPAEYVLMMHYMDEIDWALQAKIANFLRTQQSADGSYPLYKGGPGDISCTVKTYYAMKLAGDSTEAAHMLKARAWILAEGGAGQGQCFDSRYVGYVRADPLTRSALHPGGNHAAAQVVPVSSEQSILLVAYRDGSAVHSLHLQSQSP